MKHPRLPTLLLILSSFLYSFPSQSQELPGSWQLVEVSQDPPFDPQFPDRFDCPQLLKLELNSEGLQLRYPDEQASNYLRISRPDGRRRCEKIDLNGGIFASGRRCDRASYRSLATCEESAVLDESPGTSGIWEIETCRNDFPLNCRRTDYRWRVKLSRSSMEITFDCVNCGRTLKQGRCLYRL